MNSRFLNLFASLVLTCIVFSSNVSFGAQPKATFLMPVEDTFTISGRGVVVTGHIERGQVETGQQLQLLGLGPTHTVTVMGIEMQGKLRNVAKTGDSVGFILKGVDKAAVKRGQVLATVGSLKATQRFRANVHFMTAAEGGRKTAINQGYRPQVTLRTSDFSATITLPKAMASLSPGADALLTIELTESAALEKGQKFTLREAGRTIGTGVVEGFE